MKKALALLTTATFLLVFFTRCNKTNTVAPSVVRVFTIDPRLPAQDVYINNQVQLSALSYGNNTSALNVFPGTYNLKFAATGSSDGTDYNIDFNAGKSYMMFLVNDNGDPKAEVFDQSFLRLGIDTSEIRFFSFSPDAPLMDVAFKNTDTSKLDTTYTYYKKRFFNDVYANRSTYGVFQRIQSGTYYLKLRYADTTIAFDSVKLTFADRQSYTIMTRGFFDSTKGPAFTIDTLQH